jgi:transglycosylase-like protein with SLT domain
VAKEHNLNPCLLAGLIHHESGWNPNAKSYVGARGLGQIMPGTWTSINRLSGYGYPMSYITRPYENMRVAAFLPNYNLVHYGSLRNALVAYNAGGARAFRPDSQLPRETLNYIRVVPATMLGYQQVYPELCKGDIVRGTSGIPSTIGPIIRSGSGAQPTVRPEQFKAFEADEVTDEDTVGAGILPDLWRSFIGSQ